MPEVFSVFSVFPAHAFDASDAFWWSGLSEDDKRLEVVRYP